MIYLNIGGNTYVQSILRLSFIVLITEGCLGYTVYCEVGGGVCLDFYKNNSFDTYVIKKGNLSICISFDGQSTYIFQNNFGNKSAFNCSVSGTIMSVCIENFQPEVGGTFSLHNSAISNSDLLESISLVKASQQYNLTGSSQFAELGMAFTWTCKMFVPSGQTANAVMFYRNNVLCVAIGHINNECLNQSANPRYTYECLSDYVYTLTIPAENMTEDEQGSMWSCEYVFNSSYRSSDIILKIAVDVHNVSLIPRDNPLIIREGTQKSIRCAINSNVVPAPTITWYLGFTDITNTTGKVALYKTITGNRTDNTKTLQCRATNNNKPPKTASTTISVEYPPTINTLSQQTLIEGRDLLVTCQAIPGNPSSTTFYWTKMAVPGFIQKGSTLQLYNIQRSSSGTYKCTAENSYGNGEKGTDSQSIVVNVLYPPIMSTLSRQTVREGRDLSVNCTATPGNPSSTTFYWTKVDNSGFRQNGPALQLPNIQRSSAGTYRCTAENSYSNGEKGTHSQTMVVNVLYPPFVYALPQQDIIEEKYLYVTCLAIPGNPSSTTFYWTKVDNRGFRQNGSALQLPNIQRTSSGTYRCTAENTYVNGESGTHSQSLVVNVLYQPMIERKSIQIVNESAEITLTRDIESNPTSNVSWFDGTQLLKSQFLVTTATFTIEHTKCTDTRNYTLVASNGIGDTLTAVELIINCKPTTDITNITLGVTCTTGIEFSTTIIAYPEPFCELEYENGTKNNQMITTITGNEVNNFTVQIRQAVVEKRSFGVYFLRVSNIFGETTVIVNVIEQRRPDIPRNIEVTCKVTGAIVQWISSFNGGDTQNFTVITLSGQDGTSLYNGINDKGENKIHATYVSSLEPSVTYWFSVSAKNSHGSSSSKAISCTTVKETASSQTWAVAGSIGGALVLATIVLILGIVVHRRYTCIYTFNIAFEKRKMDTKVDTNKEASNYTTIKEQQEHTERNIYDELKQNEHVNEYEDIQRKDNPGNNEKLYEKLQKSIDNDGEAKSTNKMIPLKSIESSDDKSVPREAEEYTNTSFMK